jgi:hypothetical protein
MSSTRADDYVLSMRCDLCQRHSEPGDDGWVSITRQLDGGEKPLVSTYCPRCLDDALQARPLEPRG